MSRLLGKSTLFETDVAMQFGWYVREAGERVAQGLRSLRLGPPFGKVLIFYRVTADGIELWRLMHGARNLPLRLPEAPEG